MDGTFSRLQYIPRRQLQVRKTFPKPQTANNFRCKWTEKESETGHQHEIQMVKIGEVFKEILWVYLKYVVKWILSSSYPLTFLPQNRMLQGLLRMKCLHSD